MEPALPAGAFVGVVARLDEAISLARVSRVQADVKGPKPRLLEGTWGELSALGRFGPVLGTFVYLPLHYWRQVEPAADAHVTWVSLW